MEREENERRKHLSILGAEKHRGEPQLKEKKRSRPESPTKRHLNYGKLFMACKEKVAVSSRAQVLEKKLVAQGRGAGKRKQRECGAEGSLTEEERGLNLWGKGGEKTGQEGGGQLTDCGRDSTYNSGKGEFRPIQGDSSCPFQDIQF